MGRSIILLCEILDFDEDEDECEVFRHVKSKMKLDRRNRNEKCG